MRDMVEQNAKMFEKELAGIAKHAQKNVRDVIVKTCIDLFSSICRRTPVDTGRARAGWNIDFEEGDEAPSSGYAGGAAAASFANTSETVNFANKAQLYYFEKVVIYNNVEYIEFLEDGHSKQAPSGMVSLSLLNFAMQLSRNAEKAGFK